jgi:hypothetical protein
MSVDVVRDRGGDDIISIVGGGHEVNMTSINLRLQAKKIFHILSVWHKIVREQGKTELIPKLP